jgi:class 3 adenylate cyclase
VLLRIGLHTGRPELTASGYIGIDVHRAARVMAAGNGGQIVTSEAFAAAMGGALPAGTRLRQLGAVQLRGFSETESLFLVSTPAVGAAGP